MENGQYSLFSINFFSNRDGNDTTTYFKLIKCTMESFHWFENLCFLNLDTSTLDENGRNWALLEGVWLA